MLEPPLLWDLLLVRAALSLHPTQLVKSASIHVLRHGASTTCTTLRPRQHYFQVTMKPHFNLLYSLRN